jgi:hypothetical protein
MSVVSHVNPDDPEIQPDPGIEIGPSMSLEEEKDIVDAFLSSDASTQDTEEVEIHSWSERLGRPFVLTVKELNERELGDIFEMFEEAGAMGSRQGRRQMRGSKPNRRLTEMSAHIVAAGLVAPDFTKAVGHGSLATFLLEKFKPLELSSVAEIIMDLSGGGEDAVTVVKNSSSAAQD